MTRSRVDNPDLLPYALYLLGGSGEFVDVEEMFLKCYELAPERFRWRTKALPNYKTLSKALRDSEAAHPGMMLKTSSGLGRRLSAEGMAWIQSRLGRFEDSLGVPTLAPATKVRSQRFLQDFAATGVVMRFLAGDRSAPNRYEVAEALLCAPDSPPEAWCERLEVYRSAATAGRRPDLLLFLDFLSDVKPEWFGGTL